MWVGRIWVQPELWGSGHPFGASHLGNARHPAASLKDSQAHPCPYLPKQVELGEFLEIMTQQLTRLAEQKEHAEAAATRAEGGEQGGSATATDAAIAAVLPFDVVATAYRRKKLMGALEEDDK